MLHLHSRPNSGTEACSSTHFCKAVYCVAEGLHKARPLPEKVTNLWFKGCPVQGGLEGGPRKPNSDAESLHVLHEISGPLPTHARIPQLLWVSHY